MTFDSIQNLLTWYARRRWLNPPKAPGNHDFLSMGKGTFLRENIEDVWNTYLSITKIINKLSNRNRALLISLFCRKQHKEYLSEKETHEQIAMSFNCSERTIYRIKNTLLADLKQQCEKKGFFGVPRFEKPRYIKGKRGDYEK